MQDKSEYKIPYKHRPVSMCYITTSTSVFHDTVQYYTTTANHGVY